VHKLLSKKILIGFIALIAGCQVQGPGINVHLTDNPIMVNNTLNSTVAIVEARPSGLIGPICTAFYISPRILGTANHCVKPRGTQATQIAPGLSISTPVENLEQELGREILIVDLKSHNDFINNHDANPMITVHRTTVIQFDEERDIALIKLVDGEPSSLYYFRVSGILPNVGSRIYEIGMPMRQFWLFTQGIVSSVRRYPDGHVEIIHQAHVTHGASGGPVFNDGGEIIGITTAFIRDTNYIGYAATSLDLLRLLHLEEHPSHEICTKPQCALPSS